MDVSSDTPNYIVKDRFSLSYQTISGFRWDIDNDLMRMDTRRDDYNVKLYNSLSTFVHYGKHVWSLKAGVRNTLYNDADDMSLFPVSQPLMVYDKQMQSTAYLCLEHDIAPVNIRLNTMVKALEVKPWEYVMDMETFEFVKHKKPEDQLLDVNAELRFIIKLTENLWINSAYTHHESDMDTDDRNVLRQSEMGIGYSSKLTYSTDMAASFDWQNRQGDSISSQRNNLYNNRIRIRYGISPLLNLSVGFTNHLCSDERLSKILLISNYLRGSLKYTYPFDENSSSYTILAVKYSPENEASAVLLDTSIKVLSNVLLGSDVLYYPDNFTEYGTKVSLRVGTYNSLYCMYKYRDNTSNSSSRQQLGIGFDFYH